MTERLRWLAALGVLLAACADEAASVGAVDAASAVDAGDVEDASNVEDASDMHTVGDAEVGDGAGPDLPPAIDDETRAALQALRYDEGELPADPSNAYADDPAARALGQRLFFETALSGRLLSQDNDGTLPTLGLRGEAGRVGCASCHVPASGFFDTRSHHQQISLAASWTRRRSPTLLESGALPVLNWDGAHDSLWSQAIGVMESAVEFNSSRLFVAQQVFRLHRAEYEQVFGAMPELDDAARFPQLAPLEAGCDDAMPAVCRGKPGDGADYDGMQPAAQDEVTRVTVNAAKAIAAYVRQLRCGSGAFDAWLDGDDSALSNAEQRGAVLFVGEAKCSSCHSGPRLTDGAFHNVGLRPATVAVAFTDTGDRGAAEGLPLAFDNPLNSRGTFSDGDRETLPPAVTPEHEGAFRTPTLRCASRAPSFMHTGQLRTLEQVVTFFNQGGHPSPGYPGTSELTPLGLTDQERADLAAFLRTLNGPGPDATLLSPPE